MRQELFVVDSGIIREAPLAPDVQVVFHAMNKSGSEALSNVLQQAFTAYRRYDEFHSHFRLGLNQQQFFDRVNNHKGGGFFIDHYLYGSLKPRPGRVLLTQFRHPLPRLLSAYNWIKRHTPNGETNFPVFKKWVEQMRGVYHSQVVQLGINWAGVGTPEFSKQMQRLQAAELYERSMAALEREVFAVGIAEYFEESIFLYAKLLRLPQVPAWQRDKRNEDRPLSTEIDREAIELAEHVNRHDYMLYNHAVAKFWTQFVEPQSSKKLDVYKLRCSGEYRDRLVQQGA